MLLIEQFDHSQAKVGTVRCPVCKQGRLFDKAAVTKVTAVGVAGRAHAARDNQIFIKCPKCARCIGITFAH